MVRNTLKVIVALAMSVGFNMLFGQVVQMYINPYLFYWAVLGYLFYLAADKIVRKNSEDGLIAITATNYGNERCTCCKAKGITISDKCCPSGDKGAEGKDGHSCAI